MNVTQAIKPLGVCIGLANFMHEYIVVVWLHVVNAFQEGGELLYPKKRQHGGEIDIEQNNSRQ